MSDPYLTLGVAADADDTAIRAAYLAAIKASPPEQNPKRFEALRNAYEAIRTRKDRLAYDLFDTSPLELIDVLDRAAPVAQPCRPDRKLFTLLIRAKKDG